MHRSCIARFAILLVASAFLLGGCDSSSPTDPLAGQSVWAGNWQGTTGQGRTITFTVGGTAQAPLVTELAFTIQIDEPSQGPGPLTCVGAEASVNTDMADLEIVNGAFAIVVPGSGPLAGFSVGIEGMFDSTVAASGQLTAETPPTVACVGRATTGWTAQRV